MVTNFLAHAKQMFCLSRRPAAFRGRGVVELGTIIGYYTAIGNALNVFEVKLPPGQAPYFS